MRAWRNSNTIYYLEANEIATLLRQLSQYSHIDWDAEVPVLIAAVEWMASVSHDFFVSETGSVHTYQSLISKLPVVTYYNPQRLLEEVRKRYQFLCLSCGTICDDYWGSNRFSIDGNDRLLLPDGETVRNWLGSPMCESCLKECSKIWSWHKCRNTGMQEEEIISIWLAEKLDRTSKKMLKSKQSK